jgi:nitrilase
MIVDPWGEIKDVLPTGNGVVSTEINLELIAETRETFPALSHRKIETNG